MNRYGSIEAFCCSSGSLRLGDTTAIWLTIVALPTASMHLQIEKLRHSFVPQQIELLVINGYQWLSSIVDLCQSLPTSIHRDAFFTAVAPCWLLFPAIDPV